MNRKARCGACIQMFGITMSVGGEVVFSDELIKHFYMMFIQIGDQFIPPQTFYLDVPAGELESFPDGGMIDLHGVVGDKMVDLLNSGALELDFVD